MSEPESLDTDELLDARVARHRFDRLIMLSDGVFAIAATLAAIEIRLPDDATSLADMFGKMQLSLLAYLVSFAVIATYWQNSRELFARLKRVDVAITLLTLATLCLVALIPAATHALYTHGAANTSLRAYALVMTVCGGLTSAAWVYAGLRPGMLVDGVTRRYWWNRLGMTVTAPLLFLIIVINPTRAMLPILMIAVAVIAVARRLLLPVMLKEG